MFADFLKSGNPPSILVIGDVMLDTYLLGESHRLSPEAPVPVVLFKTEKSVLGGAGNVVSNLSALRARVEFVSVVGDDKSANLLDEMLNHEGIDVKLFRDSTRRTTQKTRIIAGANQIVRLDNETISEISDEIESEIINYVKVSILKVDCVVLSDYGKGVLKSSLLKKIIEIANHVKVPIIVDPKGKDFSKYKGSTLLTPNRSEASLATGIEITDLVSCEAAMIKLRKITGIKLQLVTLGSDGIAFLDLNKAKVQPALANEVYDVSGAGDTVISTLAYCISKKIELRKAIFYANIAASVVVRKLGASSASIEEIVALESEFTNLPSAHNSPPNSFPFLLDCKKLPDFRKLYKNKKIIFTNGCFDIMHVGHLSLIKAAKDKGDVLVVGLNSDNSVKYLKGPDRPINNEKSRIEFLSGLKWVDYVVLFNEPTPLKVIKLLRPDVIVKGGDYKEKEVVGFSLVKEVVIVPLIEGYSTTSLFNKLN